MGLFAGKLQLKTALHVHTSNSDGADPLRDVVEEHYARDFDILAITDHGFVTYDWVSAPNGLTTARFNEISTGSDRGNRPMLMIPNSAEQSTNFVHVNTFLMNYLYPPNDEVALEQLLIQGQTLNGLIHLNHPTMQFVGANANNPVYIDRFVDLFTRFPVMVGQEIINMYLGAANYDPFPNDRIFWDNLNSILIPQGRFVWGFGNDDTHNNLRTGFCWSVMVVPDNTLASFRDAMNSGSFYVVSRGARLEGVANLDRDNPYTPVIDDIEIDDRHIGITAHNFSRIEWITTGTRRIAQGPVLDFTRLPEDVGPFARANVIGSGGIAFTQPFVVHRVIPKHFDLYSNISLHAEPYLPDHLIPMRYLSAPEPEIPPAPPPPDPSEFPTNPRNGQKWQNEDTLEWWSYDLPNDEWVFIGIGAGVGILPPTPVPPVAIAMDMVKIAVNTIGDAAGVPAGDWFYIPVFRLPNRRGICITFDIHAARHTYSNSSDQTLSGTAHLRFTDDPPSVVANDTFMFTKHQSWHRRVAFRILPNTTGNPRDYPLEIFIASRNDYMGATVLIRDCHRLTRLVPGFPDAAENAIEEIQITSNGYEVTPSLPRRHRSDPLDPTSPWIDPAAGIQILRETGASYIDYIGEVTLSTGFSFYALGNRIEYNGTEVRLYLTMAFDTTASMSGTSRLLFVMPPGLAPTTNLYAAATVNWWANASRQTGDSSAAYIAVTTAGSVVLEGALPDFTYGGYILFHISYAVNPPGTTGLPYVQPLPLPPPAVSPPPIPVTRPPSLASQIRQPLPP